MTTIYRIFYTYEPIEEINKIKALQKVDLVTIGYQVHSIWHNLLNKNLEIDLVNYNNILLLIQPEKLKNE